MNEKVPNIRRIAVQLDMSGTAIPISETKLYKGGFGFVNLVCYVPVTVYGSKNPICTVSKISIDSAGNRAVSDKYPMMWVGVLDINGVKHSIFECPCPKAFTDIEGELSVIYNFYETVSGKAAAVLTSSPYATQVFSSILNDDAIQLDDVDAIASTVNGISKDIDALQADVTAETNARLSGDNELAARITNEVTARNSADDAINSELAEVRSIASNRTSAKVFDTKLDMDAWLAVDANKATLRVGDSLLIRESSTPDYWWDGSMPLELEINKVFIDDYYTKSVIDGKISNEANALQDNIDAEKQARQQSDSGHSAAIDAEKQIREDQIASLQSSLSRKVNSESGKGLSSNDFTDAHKAEILKLRTDFNNFEIPPCTGGGGESGGGESGGSSEIVLFSGLKSEADAYSYTAAYSESQSTCMWELVTIPEDIEVNVGDIVTVYMRQPAIDASYTHTITGTELEYQAVRKEEIMPGLGMLAFTNINIREKVFGFYGLSKVYDIEGNSRLLVSDTIEYIPCIGFVGTATMIYGMKAYKDYLASEGVVEGTPEYETAMLESGINSMRVMSQGADSQWWTYAEDNYQTTALLNIIKGSDYNYQSNDEYHFKTLSVDSTENQRGDRAMNITKVTLRRA